jgi:hypothetical protein
VLNEEFGGIYDTVMYGRSDMNLACEEYDGEDEPVSLKYDVELPYYSIRTEV